jgi:hypothetical protein
LEINFFYGIEGEIYYHNTSFETVMVVITTTTTMKVPVKKRKKGKVKLK